MGTGNHGGFGNTYGSEKRTHFLETKDSHFKEIEDETTAAVWKHMNATQENYSGTKIPKSFSVDVPITKETPAGKMWTHGNATEHVYEAVSSKNDNPRLKNSNPDLYTQFILYDFYKSVSKVVRNGVNYEKRITSGRWDFVFSRPRSGQQYPVIKHAKFHGL